MLRRNFFALLAALLCLGILPAVAAEVPCLAGEALPENLAGIWITQVPEGEPLMLGDRVLRPGDVLTADQAAQMTFSGTLSQVEYLPIFSEGAAEAVSVTVGKQPSVPVAEDSAVETYKNMPINGKLKATGENLTFTVTRQPRRGTVELTADGGFTYTPKKNKVGIDSFTYTAAGADGKASREATVTITILKPTDASQYTDTEGLDCRFTAQWLKNTGIFTGETLGENLCFNPEKCVTRGEFVTMLVKALDIPVDETLTASGYTDEIPTWLQPFLAAAQRAGVTAGLPDQQTFAAHREITATEAAAMVETALDGTVEAMAALETAPDRPLTRAQAAQLLYQAAKK